MAFGLDDFALLLLGGGLLGAGQAGLNMAGSAMSYKEQRKLQKRAQQFEAEQAKINRDWMTEMSNTAHQREVADLRTAGLNPILSATGGSGASTPSASTAVSGNMPSGPDYSGLGDAMTKGLLGAVETGLDLKKASATIDNVNAQTDNLDTASELNRAKVAAQNYDNEIKAATKQYEIDAKKLGVEQAREKYNRTVSDNIVELKRNSWRASDEGQSAFEQYEKNKPWSGSVGTGVNVTKQLFNWGGKAYDWLSGHSIKDF